MIEHIRIENFQAQRCLELDLTDSNILSIIGESDVGKSSTIRAILWCLTNKVDDHNFVTWGQEKCSVTLKIDNHALVRYRDKKKNVYILDGVEFSCIRQDVPPEIQNVLKLGTDSFQSQFDSVFWFSLTGGELAKKMNAIVNLDAVDFCFSELASQIREVKNVVHVYQGRLENYQRKLTAFEGVSKFEENFESCKNIENKIEVFGERMSDLNYMIDEIEGVEAVLSQAHRHEVESKKWLALYKDFLDTSECIRSAQNLIGQIEKCCVPAANVVSTEVLHDIDKLFESYQKIQREHDSLKSLAVRIRNTRQEVRSMTEELEETNKEWKKTLEERCPLCGRSGKQNIRDVMDEACVHYTLDKGIENEKK